MLKVEAGIGNPCHGSCERIQPIASSICRRRLGAFLAVAR